MKPHQQAVIASVLCGCLTSCTAFREWEDDQNQRGGYSLADELGYEPDRPVVQAYREIVVPWTERAKITEICRNAIPDGHAASGCAKWTGLGPGDFCIIWYIQGDYLTRYHERHHCHEGRFHKIGENY